MFPQFICIGAAKSGTTWLHQNLKRHPEVWLPPFKELHYFDHLSSKPTAIDLLSRRFGRFKLRRIAKRLWRKKGQDIGWFLRYLFLPRSDNWYASLFSPTMGQIAGEICPEYDTLDEKIVAHIHTLMPNLKIIYLIRNPIHKMWSQAAMRYRRYGEQGIDTIEEETIKKYLDAQTTYRRSHYLKTLQIWESIYPKEQLFIGYFEQLQQNPRQLLSEIHQFIEVDSFEQYLPDEVRKNPNPGHYPAIPAHFVHHLARQHHEHLKALHQKLDNPYTANWLEFAEQHLSAEYEDKKGC